VFEGLVEFLQEPGGQGGITLQRMAARPATGIAAQLEELQRKYRIMECDRKSYAEEVEAVLRKQKLQNEKLRRESQSLKAELSLEARAASASETAVASVKETQVRDLIKEVGRQIDAEKQRGEKLDARLKSLRDRSLQERKEMGGHNAPAEHTMSTDKCIKVRACSRWLRRRDSRPAAADTTTRATTPAYRRSSAGCTNL